MACSDADSSTKSDGLYRIDRPMEGHQEKLTNMLYYQWLEGSFCDLQLHTYEGVIVNVHACVIVAFSPRIATAVHDMTLKPMTTKYKRKPKTSTALSVDVPFEYNVIKIILEALYSGILSTNHNMLNELSQAIEWFGINEFNKVVSQVQSCQDKVNGCETKQRRTKKQNEIVSTSKSSKLDNSKRKGPSQPPQESVKSSSDSNNDLVQDSDFTNMVISLNDELPFTVSINTANSVCYSNYKNGDDEDINSHTDQGEDKNKCLDRRMNDNINSSTQEEKDDAVAMETFADLSNGFSLSHDFDRDYNENCEPFNPSTNFSCPVESREDGITLDKRKKRKGKTTQLKKESSTKNKKKLSSRKSTKSCKKLSADVNKTNNDGHNHSSTNNILPLDIEVKQEIEDDDVAYMEELNSGISDNHLYRNVNDKTDLSGEKDMKCDKCKVSFTDIEQFQEHVTDHMTFTCEICLQVFFSRSTLIRHMRGTHFKSVHLKCPLCEFTAVNEAQYKEHCISVHEKIQPFYCQFEGCDFKALRYRNLSRHFEKHENLRTHQCDKCEKTFGSYGCLYSHQRSCYHVQKYLCDLCGQCFNHPSSMKIHRRSKHFGEKSYQCKMCGKTFSYHANLRRHMRIHNNTFPYSCSLCDKQFRHSNSLKLHMDKHNSGGSSPESMVVADVSDYNMNNLHIVGHKNSKVSAAMESPGNNSIISTTSASTTFNNDSHFNFSVCASHSRNIPIIQNVLSLDMAKFHQNQTYDCLTLIPQPQTPPPLAVPLHQPPSLMMMSHPLPDLFLTH